MNGVESSEGAAEYELSPGDRVQWDYRPWDEAKAVPAIVGAFPEPFLHGLEGKRRPVRVECADADSAPAATAGDRLEAAGVPTSSSTVGAPEHGDRHAARGGPLAAARGSCAGRPTLERGPGGHRRVRALRRGRRELELLDESGAVARTVGPATAPRSCWRCARAPTSWSGS